MSPNLEIPVFQIFRVRIPYINNETQSSGLLPIAAASVSVGAPARAWCKNSLAFASDIGSLVVIGRFRDLGITSGTETQPAPGSQECSPVLFRTWHGAVNQV